MICQLGVGVIYCDLRMAINSIKSINQPINQSVSQSASQSVSESVNQSVSQSILHSTNQSHFLSIEGHTYSISAPSSNSYSSSDSYSSWHLGLNIRANSPAIPIIKIRWPSLKWSYLHNENSYVIGIHVIFTEMHPEHLFVNDDTSQSVSLIANGFAWNAQSYRFHWY